MAIVTIPAEGTVLTDESEIAKYLAGIGIQYERWEATHAVAPDAPAEEVLAAYGAEVERLKARGGYVVADLIDVTPSTPGLDLMLEKFKREHWHDEDEVRFVIEGRGVFHVQPQGGPVTAIEVVPGDLICVPSGTRHWFNLCADRRIRAIRLFQDPSGWTPHYTESGVDGDFQPGCFGPAYLPSQGAAA